MFRVLFYLLGIVLVISILRSVMEVIGRMFADFSGSSQGSAGRGGQPRRPAVPLSEALKKDPVCGAFVAPSAAVQKTIGSSTYYFCSPDCRDKYAG